MHEHDQILDVRGDLLAPRLGGNRTVGSREAGKNTVW